MGWGEGEGKVGYEKEGGTEKWWKKGNRLDPDPCGGGVWKHMGGVRTDQIAEQGFDRGE